ncbi:MAG: B12-binding domain-containing radical SAM protein [Acidobacteriota bacterium]|nr:B12-binding domain-containing radical SAM protein [Acidobacteriota bacterium]
MRRPADPQNIAVLLVGPYDPHCGEYTFLAPPLGVWRLAGVLRKHGVEAEVFDPNCVDDVTPEEAFAAKLRSREWSVIGFSTTGMTLRFDLALAHQARTAAPRAVLVAGGMEATFAPETIFALAPIDMVVLGEGERPLVELAGRLRAGEPLDGIAGTARLAGDGTLARIPQRALDAGELRDAIFSTPYDEMPYERYWQRLEEAYAVGSLPMKADREARLAEIRSVRLITLNYCPMRCTFCSSTNFLNAAQDSTARIARLEADDCVTMMRRIVAAHPGVRTIIFQDDIFVFPTDRRILPLTEAIVAAKDRGELPRALQFISTNRVDAMTPERIAAMRAAGFRVLGFGIESFSPAVLKEFNKSRIEPAIEPALNAALVNGVTPFLDIILTSPHATLADLTLTIGKAFRWIEAGCEVGMYPYVIPFTGAAMANDPALVPQTRYTLQSIAGTAVRWQQPSTILPFDPVLRAVIATVEELFAERLAELESRHAHLPSRVRSLLWIACAAPVLRALGQEAPDAQSVEARLQALLPAASRKAERPEALELAS